MQLHSSPLLQCHEAIREGDVQILIRALLISPYSRNYWHGVYAQQHASALYLAAGELSIIKAEFAQSAWQIVHADVPVCDCTSSSEKPRFRGR